MAKTLVVPKLDKEKQVLTIYGSKPLLCQRLPRERTPDGLPKWPTTLDKLEDEIAWEYYLRCLYLDDDNIISFPAVAIKKSCVEAARVIPGQSMTKLRGLFYINGNAPYGYVPILDLEGNPLGQPPEFVADASRRFKWMNSGLPTHPYVDMIHLKQGGAVPACYAMIELPWSINLEVEWSPTVTNLQEIANVLEHAGHFVGIGPRRLVRSGSPDFGLFTLVKPE